MKQDHSHATVLVHPECVREVRELADYIGSTAQMYDRVKNSSSKETEFIIGTERGLMERMAIDFPKKHFYLASEKMVCYNMKKHNLELIKYVLLNLNDKSFEVKVPFNIAKKALIPIENMLKYS